jgi:radical SAM-linked protein
LSRYLVRVRFSKLGKIRFTSHRDVARIFERALRKASLPVAYTEGFSPRPKLSFGLALPTGHESLGEYLDVDLTSEVDIGSLIARLGPALPVGLDVQGAAVVEPGTPSLQQAVVSCTWRITVTGEGVPRLPELAARALAAGELPITRERKGHEVSDDLRPSILSLAVSGPRELDAELATQPRGVRPSELVTVLDCGLELDAACRVHQWINIDGAKREPLPLPSHADVRAS